MQAACDEFFESFDDALREAVRQMGGHKPKTLSGKIRDWLLERCRSRDFTLRGLVVELAERDVLVDYHSVWDFVHAEGLTHKKRHSSRASRNDRT